MRILVTGAAGFIASHLCEKLQDLGHEVVGIDNFNDYYSPALKRLNASDLKAKGIEVFEIDLNANLTSVFSTPYDYIYHLAAQPGISSETPLSDYVTNNIFATQSLLDAVLQYNPNLKSFINIATSSVYGLVANVDENVPAKPISFYGSTKLAAEQLVLGLQRLGKLNACSIRLYSVYGPRERPEKLYTKLIENLHANKPSPLFEGSVKHERSFTFVAPSNGNFITLKPLVTGTTGSWMHVDNIRIESALSLDDRLFENEITSFPNPFTNTLSFKLNNIDDVSELRIFDLAGREIIKKEFINELTFETFDFNPGLYFYTITNQNQILKKGKIIKKE